MEPVVKKAYEFAAKAHDVAVGNHAAHITPAPGDLSIPYAFPKAGRYRIWVQMKHEGRVMTAAFDANVRPGR